MNRLRPLGLPLMLLGCSALLYGVNHFGRWHSNKAEGGMWLFGVIALVWLPFAVYRVVKPLPIAVGLDVVIMLGERDSIVGTVVKMEGEKCTVRTARGDYVVNRYAIVSIVKKP